jgi:hypothetical protein
MAAHLCAKQASIDRFSRWYSWEWL